MFPAKSSTCLWTLLTGGSPIGWDGSFRRIAQNFNAEFPTKCQNSAECSKNDDNITQTAHPFKTPGPPKPAQNRPKSAQIVKIPVKNAQSSPERSGIILELPKIPKRLSGMIRPSLPLAFENQQGHIFVALLT